MQHEPTAASRARVRVLAGPCGMRPAAIGVLLGISAAAVLEHYANELRRGPLEVEAKVRQALLAAAMRGDRAALRMLRRA